MPQTGAGLHHNCTVDKMRSLIPAADRALAETAPRHVAERPALHRSVLRAFPPALGSKARAHCWDSLPAPSQDWGAPKSIFPIRYTSARCWCSHQRNPDAASAPAQKLAWHRHIAIDLGTRYRGYSSASTLDYPACRARPGYLQDSKCAYGRQAPQPGTLDDPLQRYYSSNSGEGGDNSRAQLQ